MAKKKIRKITLVEEHYIKSFCFEKTVDSIAQDLCLETKDIKELYNKFKSKPKNKFDVPSDGVVSMTASQSMQDDETSKMTTPENIFNTRLKQCIYRRPE
jgi:hypothetical protein